jgi:hypothetical protein
VQWSATILLRMFAAQYNTMQAAGLHLTH